MKSPAKNRKEAANKAAVDAVIAQIGALNDQQAMFNNADAQQNADGAGIIANINSGRYELGIVPDNVSEGAAKFSKIAFDGTHNIDVAFRGDAVNPANYASVAFDIYLSEGVSVNDASNTNIWAQFQYQNALTNNAGKSHESVIASDAALKDALSTLDPGQWNTVVMAIPADLNNDGIVQLGMRINNFTMKIGEYVIFDNVRFIATTGGVVTLEDKDAVTAARAAYNALTFTQKVFIFNEARFVELEMAIEAGQ